MARESKTEYVVLGLLNREPMTGYQIRQVISGSIGYFWQESYGQIYPALKRLHDRGLVKRRVQSQSGKPDRHEYSITARGRDRFHRWLSESPDRERVRQELLLKLFFASMGEVEDSLRYVEEYRSRQKGLLETFHEIETGYFASIKDDPRLPFWKMTLSYGQHLARARLAWTNETIENLRKIKNKKRRKKA